MDTPCKLSIDNCNNYDENIGCGRDCDFYNPVDEAVAEKMDEVLIEKADANESKLASDEYTLKFSGFEKFTKTYEFIVIKKHIFEIQSVSPKKIILKFKRKLNDTDNVADGCYVITDKEGNPHPPHKVFNKFKKGNGNG